MWADRCQQQFLMVTMEVCCGLVILSSFCILCSTCYLAQNPNSQHNKSKASIKKKKYFCKYVHFDSVLVNNVNSYFRHKHVQLRVDTTAY